MLDRQLRFLERPPVEVLDGKRLGGDARRDARRSHLPLAHGIDEVPANRPLRRFTLGDEDAHRHRFEDAGQSGAFRLHPLIERGPIQGGGHMRRGGADHFAFAVAEVAVFGQQVGQTDRHLVSLYNRNDYRGLLLLPMQRAPAYGPGGAGMYHHQIVGPRAPGSSRGPGYKARAGFALRSRRVCP